MGVAIRRARPTAPARRRGGRGGGGVEWRRAEELPRVLDVFENQHRRRGHLHVDRRRHRRPCSTPRIAGGDAPDVAMLPQPGLLGDFAAQGVLQPIEDVAGSTVDENYAADLAHAGHGRRHAVRRLVQGARTSRCGGTTRTSSRTPASKPPQTFDDLLTVDADGRRLRRHAAVGRRRRRVDAHRPVRERLPRGPPGRSSTTSSQRTRSRGPTRR